MGVHIHDEPVLALHEVLMQTLEGVLLELEACAFGSELQIVLQSSLVLILLQVYSHQHFPDAAVGRDLL